MIKNCPLVIFIDIVIVIVIGLGIFPSKTYAAQKLSFIHSDHLGSTSLVTDEQGNIKSQQVYYPYGSTRLATTPAGGQATEHQYTGQISDQEQTGLYYYNARYYDSALAKFTQADTLIGPNRYLYTSNNPIIRTDPSGHMDIADDFGGGGGSESQSGSSTSTPLYSIGPLDESQTRVIIDPSVYPFDLPLYSIGYANYFLSNPFAFEYGLAAQNSNQQIENSLRYKSNWGQYIQWRTEYEKLKSENKLLSIQTEWEDFLLGKRIQEKTIAIAMAGNGGVQRIQFPGKYSGFMIDWRYQSETIISMAREAYDETEDVLGELNKIGKIVERRVPWTKSKEWTSDTLSNLTEVQKVGGAVCRGQVSFTTGVAQKLGYDATPLVFTTGSGGYHTATVVNSFGEFFVIDAVLEGAWSFQNYVNMKGGLTDVYRYTGREWRRWPNYYSQ